MAICWPVTRVSFMSPRYLFLAVVFLPTPHLLAGQAPDSARRCGPADAPRKLPALDQVLDSTALRRFLGTVTVVGQPREMLLSLGFDTEGALRSPQVLTRDMGTDSAIVIGKQVMLLVKPQEPVEDPWAVRVRIILAETPRFAVERSEFCPPLPDMLPSVGRVFLGPMAPDEARSLQNARRAQWRVLVSADGLVSRVELRQSSGSRELDDHFIREQETARYKPALIDGVPVSAWIEGEARVKRR